MSISEEQFDQTLYNLRHMGMDVTAAVIRARDTAQREDLAQMKTERDQYDELHLESIALAARHEQALARVEAELSYIRHKAFTAAMARDTAQAQLAEAVGLLRKVAAWPAEDCTYGQEQVQEAARVFLARYAQAEQQEAQGTQAGDFWTWLDLAYRDGSKGEGRNFTKHNMEVAYRAGAEDARAALATQPVVREVK